MNFGSVIPALDGRHIFEVKKQHKTTNLLGQSQIHELRKCDPHARWEWRLRKQQTTRTSTRAVPLAQMKESCGDFQETCFYCILAAEGSQKPLSVLPPSTRINKNERHAAWECQFRCFEHPRRDTHARFWTGPLPSIGELSTGEQEELEYVRAKLEMDGLALFFGGGEDVYS